MKIADQISVVASLEKALVPAPSLIDGRTERDRLHFLCEFASLISFYDKDNIVNGNWKPFLLKDPVFLLAYISKTDFKREHKYYEYTCTSLQKLASSDPHSPYVAALFNQLFDLLTKVFMQIGDWARYMQMNDEEYELKKYVISEVKQKFSSYLWAVLSLRNNLASGNAIKDIVPVYDYVFNTFDQSIWTEKGGKTSFLEVLGIDMLFTPEIPFPFAQKYYDGLKNAGDLVFRFFHTIIRHAVTDYEKVKNERSRYPDTLLLRAFGDLLEIEQQELNEISKKHLRFYYKDILKQSELPAETNSVFITVVLGKNTSTFNLPAGTLFNAGADAKKNPILFQLQEDINLNAGVISSVYTIASVTKNSGGKLSAHFNSGASANYLITTIVTQGDVGVLIGGQFTSYDKITAGYITRLKQDGTLDSSFNSGLTIAADMQVNAIVLQNDGNMLIGGNFTEYDRLAANRIARLDKNGTLDTSFNSKVAGDVLVEAIALQGNDIIYSGSIVNFSLKGIRVTGGWIGRLDKDGNVDPLFVTAAIDSIVPCAVAVQSDKKIIVGGGFTSYNKTSANRIVRLSETGIIDTSFATGLGSGADADVRAIAIQNDGKIILGGSFNYYNGIESPCVVRINSDGSIDKTFSPGKGANDTVRKIVLQDDKKILIGGDFTSYNGTVVNRIARLNADGSLDENFNQGSGANDSVYDIALFNKDEKIFAVGAFTKYNYAPNKYIVCINGNNKSTTLVTEKILDPGIVVNNEAGQPVAWNTFGSNKVPTGANGSAGGNVGPAGGNGGSGGNTSPNGSTAIVATTVPTVDMGIGFASPMFYLLEGTRNITVALSFSELELSVFQTASFFLTTTKGWLDVSQYVQLTPTPAQSISGTGQQISFLITLDASLPAITPLVVSPAGVSTSWPTLKIMFGSTNGLENPIVLTQLEITVVVTGVTTFELSNANGALSANTPFQPFGTVVDLGSYFLIGSQEIFSKPLSNLTLDLTWSALPADGFSEYYLVYEAYLTWLAEQFFSEQMPLPPLPPQSLITTEDKTEAENKTSNSNSVKPNTPAKESFLKKVWKGFINVITFPVRAIINAVRKRRNAKKTIVTPAVANKNKTEIPTDNSSSGSNSFAATDGMNEDKKKTSTANSSSDSDPFFGNEVFTVDFQTLNNGSWGEFAMVNTGPGASHNQLFVSDASPATTVQTDSIFTYTKTGTASPLPDPSIQSKPLQFGAASSSGFLQMSLKGPANGFGSAIYPNVVSWVAMNNAIILLNGIPKHPNYPIYTDTIQPPPNTPFIPTVSNITATYTSSYTYDLATPEKNDYPIECIHYADPQIILPQTTGASSSSGNAPIFQSQNLPHAAVASRSAKLLHSKNPSLVGPSTRKGIPLVATFSHHDDSSVTKLTPLHGALIMGFTGLVPGNAISLFFELVPSYSDSSDSPNFFYYYLSNKIWKTLPLISDETNQFSCSGIITLNIPNDIDGSNSVTAPVEYKIAIAVSGNISSLGRTVLLGMNGVKLSRATNSLATYSDAPVISSGAISKPQNPTPQIASVAQPFESFGGREAEDETQMNIRVSNLLKVKNRAVSNSDFFSLIQQQFPDIYYSLATSTHHKNATVIYVVKSFPNIFHANAFRPLVSTCELTAITDFLNKRVSLFSNITISNFKFLEVTINATVIIKKGFALGAMQTTISRALDVYLSPWITSLAPQTIIGESITVAQVTTFIRGIDGVKSVTKISLIDDKHGAISPVIVPVIPLPPKNSTEPTSEHLTQLINRTLIPQQGMLFVSSLNHVINITMEK